MRIVLLAPCLILLPLVAGAAPSDVTNVLAVLDVEVSDGSISYEEADTLAATLRGQAITAAHRVNVPVMTRETMVDLAPPEMLKCAIGSCMATIGKTLQSRYVMGGRVTRVDGRLSLTVEAYESKSGALLGTKVLRGANVSELQDEMEGGLSTVVRGWLEQASGADRLVTATTEIVRVRFESTPPGATVTADTGLICVATPCEESVPAGERQFSFAAKEYEKLDKTVAVKAGLAPVAVKLVPNFAELTVSTDPPGLRVLVNGQPAGQSPLERMHLLQGGHEVMIDDPCYGKVGERIELKKATSRELKYKPEPRRAALDVTVEDQAGNVLDATFEVDGKPMEGNRFKVPLCMKEMSVRTASNGGLTWRADGLVEKTQKVLKFTLRGATVAADNSRGVVSTTPVVYKTLPSYVVRDDASMKINLSPPTNWRKVEWLTGAAFTMLGLFAMAIPISEWPNANSVVESRYPIALSGGAAAIIGMMVIRDGVENDDSLIVVDR
jgi:TolB-like protein